MFHQRASLHQPEQAAFVAPCQVVRQTGSACFETKSAERLLPEGDAAAAAAYCQYQRRLSDGPPVVDCEAAAAAAASNTVRTAVKESAGG